MFRDLGRHYKGNGMQILDPKMSHDESEVQTACRFKPSLALQEGLPVLNNCIWRGRILLYRKSEEEPLSIGGDVPE